MEHRQYADCCPLQVDRKDFTDQGPADLARLLKTIASLSSLGFRVAVKDSRGVSFILRSCGAVEVQETVVVVVVDTVEGVEVVVLQGWWSGLSRNLTVETVDNASTACAEE